VVDTRHPIVYLRGSEFQSGQVGTITSQDMRDLLVSLDTGFLLAANYGVVANGVQTASAAPTGTDDTAAWAAVFAAASALPNSAVLAPPGISMVSQITIPGGVTLFGQPNSDYPFSNGGPFVNGGGSALWKIGSAVPMVIMSGSTLTNSFGSAGNQGCGIVGMSLYGLGTAQGIVQPVAGRLGIAYISRCTIANFSVGIDGSYTTGYFWGIVDGCTIMGNGVGLQDFVDSRIINNFIAANSGIGFASLGGADTLLMGNKIETNGTIGVYINAGDNMQVCNNNFDAAGFNSITWTNSINGLCANNCLRRSGNLATTGTTNDAHMFLSGNSNLIVTANTTRVLAREGSPFNNVPSYSLAGGANTSVILTANQLSGYVTAFQHPTSPATGLTSTNNFT